MEYNPLYIWLVVGVALCILEAVGVSGIGLLFAGLGALTAGFLLSTSLIAADGWLLQIVVFLLATALWAALLFKPLQKAKHKNKQAYHNIIGQTATVSEGGLSAQRGGSVQWSGTIMRAQLAEGVAESLPAGAQVVVTDIAGNILIVKSK